MMGTRFCGFLYVASYGYLVVFAVAQITDPSEVSALVAVRSRLIDPMDSLINWNQEDPCLSNWTGVLCFDSINGTDGYLHVQELRLLNMNLSGSLAPELGLLSHLQILDFMWNDLTGSIPKEIGNMSSLSHLLLNGNRLSGSLPEELGKLSNLDRLQVDVNSIAGTIPKSFANLSRVKHLHLNNNSIVGQLPPELSRLSELLHLLVDNNNLTGYLPLEYSEMPALRILQLDNNNFAGAEIPRMYGNFPNLLKLSLRDCSLQGAVPDLSRISRFYYLDLSRNQLTGHIPSDKLSDFVRNIDLSENNLTGSIPESFAELPFLQRLSLENNFLNGSIPASIWQKKPISSNDRLSLDLRNNSFSSILGDLNPPNNVTVRLGGNPICTNANIPNIGQFCDSQTEDDGKPAIPTNSKCPTHECPLDNFYEYDPASGDLCACAAPLRIGYRLKSPSFYYFPPYASNFSAYVTTSLNLSLYQLSIDSFVREKGPRLRMYLKLFPPANTTMFNSSEVYRIGRIFTSWAFSGNELFGPYELLNFTLLGPYASMIPVTRRTSSISEGVLAAILVGAIASAVPITATLTFLVTRRHARSQQSMSRRRLSRKISTKIDGVKAFRFKDLASATDNFNSSTQVGQGGYGRVYRGVLSDNTIVAIKRAEIGSVQGQKEFLTEIKLLSRLHHRNLVALLGYCDEEEEQMLVYEYIPNGTLRHWLSGKDKACLNFSMRVRIALHAAKGILYLHTEANPPVFHRDIKALDDQGTIATHVSTIVKGTPGYLDPEYLLTHKLTDKSDVYSLGVVFLELLTGMEPISHGKNIVREVNAACESGLMLSIIDNRMGPCPSECLERFVALALNCCHDKTERRPSMLDVARELENILKMMPETDATFSESTSIHSTSKSTSESASSSFMTRDQYFSSDISGSNLVSGVIPTISPRQHPEKEF
ncbi:probable LRR receptor-like serine/threonine-protein kinase At1g06840 isoform X2 [Mangifera indica]|uniref:probable LRR receptor-like serine/threonine-protein kinase At1g06840 isoform X2 n=1 Tax=Mangifera indica TaxID=29780 RepID=UPI001CF9E599|nr:probable LRR receptor-like serine/threonine-protein kinase At1g06840 isoform X2 [Mangifera indica]